MTSLDTDFGFMYELLLHATQFSGDRIHSLSAKVLHGEVFKTYSSIAGTCKDEIWLATEDHHVNSDVELTIRV